MSAPLHGARHGRCTDDASRGAAPHTSQTLPARGTMLQIGWRHAESAVGYFGNIGNGRLHDAAALVRA